MTDSVDFSSLNLWASRVALYREILVEALILLRSRPCAIDEPSLNKKLFKCLLVVQRQRRDRGEKTIEFPPIFDAPNPPVNATDTVDERKRPDLRWELMDSVAPTIEEAIVPFVVECKRLGAPVGGRILVRLYATEGVARFVHADWCYGKNADAGAMVGYVQDMTFAELLVAVNQHVGNLGLPEIVGATSRAELHIGEHSVSRLFAISPYALSHYWIDMRSVGPSQTNESVEQVRPASSRPRKRQHRPTTR